MLQAFGVVFAKDFPPGFQPRVASAPQPVLKLQAGKTMGAAAIKTNAVGSYVPPAGPLEGSPSSPSPAPAKEINLESVLQAYLDALVQGAYGPLPGTEPEAGGYPGSPQPGGYAPPTGTGGSRPPPPAAPTARRERVCHRPSPPPPPSHGNYTQVLRMHVRRPVAQEVIPQYHLSAVGL
jgi:hypothetical protein